MKAENYLYEIEPQGRKHGQAIGTRSGEHLGLGRLSAWRWKRQGCEQGTGMHTNGLRVGIENRYVCGYCGAIRKALVHNRIEIYRRKRGLGPSGPRATG